MKFLIVKCSALGDIIQTFPVIAYLKQKFPGCTIDWVVERPFAELLETHPLVDRVLKVDSKRWRRGFYFSEMKTFRRDLQREQYDAVFDLQGNMKSGILTWLAKSKQKVGFGFKTVFEWPNLLVTNNKINPLPGENVREEYLSIVKTYFKDTTHFQAPPVQLTLTDEQMNQVKQILRHPYLAHGRKVMVCPGSAWQNKRVTQEALLLFLQMMHQREAGAFLFVWGSEEERAVCQSLLQAFPQQSLIINKLQLPVLQHLMRHVSLVISMDSLPLHLAGTTGTQTFSFFGPSSLSKYKPTGIQHRGYHGLCPYGITFDRRCPKLRNCATGACLRSITGQELFNAYLTIDRSHLGEVSERKLTWRRAVKK